MHVVFKQIFERERQFVIEILFDSFIRIENSNAGQQ